ncbi:hypothetical protein AURDEDRAFT_185237 [Auricularia subglabra TFB-10046 SS5]|nr:hypothetical protein AURDEDRAFT_185237 [Auricularia subglabra TFB-10046 SS5]
MRFPPAFQDGLVGLLDDAYRHAIQPDVGLSRVSSQVIAYLAAETRSYVNYVVDAAQAGYTYSPDTSLTTDEDTVTDALEHPADPPAALCVDALPYGWTQEVDDWFAHVKERTKSADGAFRFGSAINDIVLAHRINPAYAGEGTMLPPPTSVPAAQVVVHVPAPVSSAPATTLAPCTPWPTVWPHFSSHRAWAVDDDDLDVTKTQQCLPAQFASTHLAPAAVDELMDVDTSQGSPSPSSTPPLAPESPLSDASSDELPLVTPTLTAPDTLAQPPLAASTAPYSPAQSPPRVRKSPRRYSSPAGPASNGIDLTGLVVLDDTLTLPSAPGHKHLSALAELLSGLLDAPRSPPPALATPDSSSALADALDGSFDSADAAVAETQFPLDGFTPSTPGRIARKISSQTASSQCTTSLASEPESDSEPTVQLDCFAPTPSSTSSPFVPILRACAAYCDQFDDIFALSRVCSPVRKALLKHPYLWTHVRVHSATSTDALHDILRRSAKAMQKLRLDIVLRRASHLQLLLGILGSVLRRTEHLSISSARRSDVVFRDVMRDLMQLRASTALTSLHLRFRSSGRPTTLFDGTAHITTLTCQLWQIEEVALADLAHVQEFVAIAPPSLVNQFSHAARHLFRRLPNAEVLVLNKAFNDRSSKKTPRPLSAGWRPLEWLILDQRMGPESWDDQQTLKTLQSLREEMIKGVVVLRALEGTARLIRDRLYDVETQRPNLVARLALFALDGQMHCAIVCRRPYRSHYFLDASPAVLRALDIAWGVIAELTVAAHMPHSAFDFLLAAPALGLRTVTIWLNGPGPGLQSLLAHTASPLTAGVMLREIRLVADCPRLPRVGRRFLGDAPPAPSKSCAVVAAELSAFITFHGWNVNNADIVLGRKVALEGDEHTVDHLSQQVRSIRQEKAKK